MMIETVAHLVPPNATRAFGVDLWGPLRSTQPTPGFLFRTHLATKSFFVLWFHKRFA